jgi:hypothetical protein
LPKTKKKTKKKNPDFVEPMSEKYVCDACASPVQLKTEVAYDNLKKYGCGFVGKYCPVCYLEEKKSITYRPPATKSFASS